jgi:hypothetical protein
MFLLRIRDAQELISFGVAVNFDPDHLTFLDADKHGPAWDAGFGAQAENGTLYIYGGSTSPRSGDVALGWIRFRVNSEEGLPASTILTASLAKAGQLADYKHFVDINGWDLDETIDFSQAEDTRARVCIVEQDACEGDIDGDGMVHYYDYYALKRAYGKSYPEEGFNPAADLNGDGSTDLSDYYIFKRDYANGYCPVCE